MTALQQVRMSIDPMSQEAMDLVEDMNTVLQSHEHQIAISTDHVLHGGVYYRTLMIPAGVFLTGATIRVNTTLIINGKCVFYTDGPPLAIRGSAVVPAFAGRRQAVYAEEATIITMSFATDASTVEEAEEQFTPDARRLGSRSHPECNTYLVTGV